MKEKKISIKPFLNMNLSPLMEERGEKLYQNERYPLYYQITFERRNTQVKSYFNHYLSDLEDSDDNDLELIRFESEILIKVVAHEKKKNNGDFGLTGIKGKYEVYIQPLESVFETYLKKKLMRAVKYSNTEFMHIIRFDAFDAQFNLLHKAAQLLIENLDKHISEDFYDEIEAYKTFLSITPGENLTYSYTTIMDWFCENYKSEFENKLKKHFREDSASMQKTLNALDNIIEDRVKFV